MSCDSDEWERQKWAWEKGKDERESEAIWVELRRRRGREAETREWLREWGRSKEWLRVIQISESEARVSFEGWGLNLFNMLQTTLYRGKKKVEWRRLRLETRQPPEPCEPVTIHRSDRGLDGSMLFSHGTVLHLKQTAKVNGSRVSRSDRTVRSGFKKHDPIEYRIPKWSF